MIIESGVCEREIVWKREGEKNVMYNNYCIITNDDNMIMAFMIMIIIIVIIIMINDNDNDDV